MKFFLVFSLHLPVKLIYKSLLKMHGHTGFISNKKKSNPTIQ